MSVQESEFAFWHGYHPATSAAVMVYGQTIRGTTNLEVSIGRIENTLMDMRSDSRRVYATLGNLTVTQVVEVLPLLAAHWRGLGFTHLAPEFGGEEMPDVPLTAFALDNPTAHPQCWVTGQVHATYPQYRWDELALRHPERLQQITTTTPLFRTEFRWTRYRDTLRQMSPAEMLTATFDTGLAFAVRGQPQSQVYDYLRVVMQYTTLATA